GSDAAAYGSGDFANLMADFAAGTGPGAYIQLDFTGLSPGFYRAYVYAGLPPSRAYFIFDGNQVPFDNDLAVAVNGQTVSTGFAHGVPGQVGSFAIGQTHDVLTFAMPAGGAPVRITCHGAGNNQQTICGINGVQLVKQSGNHLYVKAD